MKFSITCLASLAVAFYPTSVVGDEIFVTTLDDQGVDELDQGNDPGGSQQDLSGARIGNKGTIGWAWDETDLSGNNSIDTCSYFEQVDGTVISICYSVQFESDGSVTNGFPTFAVYDCGTTYNGAQQKCTGNNPVTTAYSVSCTNPTQVPSYFTPDDQPDLQADCTLTTPAGGVVDDLLFLNTCSKPSASPSSNSNDCLFSDEVGFLSLVKAVVGDADPSDFVLTAGTLTGTGPTVALSPVTGGMALALSESGPPNYDLQSIICVDNDTGDPVPNPSGLVTVAVNQKVTCTFTNVQQTNPPVTSAPATSAPITGAPITSAPVTGAPITSAPVTNAPATSSPVTSSPVTSAPVTRAPATGAPVTSAPATSAPATSAPVTNAPVSSAPVSGSPVTSSPITTAPATGAPITSAPATSAPVTSAPVTRSPVTSSPVTSTPATSAPVTSAPVTSAPVTSAPVTILTGAPATRAPVTNAPVTNAPVTNAPATSAPVTNAPAASVTNAPATNAPATNAPLTGAPVTNVPLTSAPVTRAPATSAPITRAPTTSAPVTNAPATGTPNTNAPVTNAPVAATAAPAAPTTAPVAPTPLPPSSFCTEVDVSNCTLCAPYRSLDYCDASNSLPALLVTRTSEYRNNGPALADDGWWFHFLEDKIAAYILSATENAPTPEILCCVTTVGQLDTCLQDDVNSNAIVIKATDFHSNQGVFVLTNFSDAAIDNPTEAYMFDVITEMSVSYSDIITSMSYMGATKIIVEDYIGTQLPTEYKFHVINGTVAAIDIIAERGGDCPCYAVIDTTGTRLDQYGCFEPGGYFMADAEGCPVVDFVTGEFRAGPVKKDLYICEDLPFLETCLLEDMIKYAEDLGSRIGVYMRIDMFVANGKFYVQEYTPNHMNGLRHCAARLDDDGCIDSCFLGAMYDAAGGPFGGVQTPVPPLLLNYTELSPQEQCDLLASVSPPTAVDSCDI